MTNKEKVDQKIQASKDGVLLLRGALKSRGWTRDVARNDQLLIEASNHLEPDKSWPISGGSGNIYADGVNETSWRRTLGKKKVAIRIFRAYCLALGLEWECVADLDEINVELPLILSQLAGSREQNDQDSSSFVADVTIPEGMIVEPNQGFTKIWEIRNGGNTAWENRYLTRIGMVRNISTAQIISPRRTRIPQTLPGQNVQIKVELRAPEVAGTYRAVWKMTFSDGLFCFPNGYEYGLFTTIIVL